MLLVCELLESTVSKEIENINDLMQALTKLPENEFDAAVTAVAVLSLGTLKQRHGRKYLKGFCHSAINDGGDTPCLNWQGPAH
jgi:hypothetical protein